MVTFFFLVRLLFVSSDSATCRPGYVILFLVGLVESSRVELDSWLYHLFIGLVPLLLVDDDFEIT